MKRQNDLAPAPRSKRERKRVGRGLGSGHGRYATRGSKGQKSRSGGGVPLYFEGGQLPLVKRLPTRRGFTNIFRKEYCIVNIGRLNAFEPGSTVDKHMFIEAGLIKSSKMPLKILGTGDLDRNLTVKADKFSTAAKKKIEAAGGRVEESGSATKAS
ncbi:MAG: 50S ribosomal protein L15 [Chloroflexi bacterium]|nr:50S ribosomal protein L15 [Chloroflexota bacterium]